MEIAEMVEMTLSELARLVDGKLSSQADIVVRGMAGLTSAHSDEATFLANSKYEKYLGTTKAAAVFVPADFKGPEPKNTVLIRCEDPYFAFRQAMVAFYGFRKPSFSGIDPHANVDPSVELGNGISIGAYSTIASRCSIGDNTVIYPGVHIGPNCQIGKDCCIYPNTTLYDGTKVGNRVTIHAGSSIGQDGFGYATHAGKHEKIPAAGWVAIEDDVEIGACCAIDRATMGTTIISSGTKLSNLVTIGHGTKLGKGCLLVAQVGIAGSTEVGDYCVFAGQSGVAGHIRIGSGAKVAAKSGVSNSIPEGQEVLGIPAIPLTEARRAMKTFSRLPQMRTALRRLTRELSSLKGNKGQKSTPKDRCGDDD